MLKTIIQFFINNYELVITAAIGFISLVVNIINAIKNRNLQRLKEALLYVPEVISQVENLAKSGYQMSGLEKKAMVETILREDFGKVFIKNGQLFDDVIEDILNTPQKKGDRVDVSKKDEKI